MSAPGRSVSVIVRPADIDVEGEAIREVLDRNLPHLSHARRFKWIYQENPLGRPWSWFVCDSATGHIVGVASVFRRALWIGSEQKLCGQVGDFAIDPSHRSLGPAVLLQRATFEPVTGGELALCYDCPPHDRGMSTFRRLGMTASANLGRYARLLRTGRHLARRLGGSWLPAVGAPIGDAILRAAAVLHPRARGLEIALHEGRFEQEFTRLDRRLSSRNVIRGRRAADDLNWRYRDDPLQHYDVLTARRREGLVGFIVLAVSEADGNAFIVDLFGGLAPEDVGGLLEASADRLWSTGAETLHAPISDGSGLAATFRRAGFHLRDRGPHVVAYSNPGSEVGAMLQGPTAWDLRYADVMA